MIAYITGRLSRSWGNSCLVVCADGLGYEVALPAHTLAALPPAGEEVAFYTSLAVREDALELFGFATFEERQCFEILVSISRIGARTALAMLSQYRPEELGRIVLEDDIGALTRVAGIGRKTAQHVLLELRYKFKGQETGKSAPGGDSPMPVAASVFRDALDGLANLGYSDEECSPVLRQLLAAEPALDVSGCLRKALKALGGRKS